MSLSWLHLTDLHAGEAQHRRLWPNVRDKFYSDLRRVFDRTGPWDLVFFTGDLTFQGSPADFEAVDRLFNDLWAEFRRLGCAPVLVVVPGNHDLVRPSDTSRPEVLALLAWHRDARVRGAFWDARNAQYQAVIDQAFAPFTAWYAGWRKAHPHEWYDSLQAGLIPGDFAMTVDKQGIRVGIVGLNSSFLQLTGDNYRKRLDLDLAQLNKVCGSEAGNWWKTLNASILLTHHPSDWLMNEQGFYAEIAQPERFLLHLYGHMHESAVEYIRTGGQLPVRMAQGASLFGLETIGSKTKRIHGYSGGRLDVDTSQARGKLRIWPRIVKFGRAGKGRYHLAPDWDNFELDKDDAFSEDVVVNIPEESPSALLLRECLALPAQRLLPELRRFSEIAQATGLTELEVARIRTELQLLAGVAQETDEARWSRVADVARRIKGPDAERPSIEIQTSFDLQRTRDEVRSYLGVLRNLGLAPADRRFLLPVKVAEGFLAPIHLLTGLLGYFNDDWTTVLTAFGRSVSDTASPSWQVLQGFIFDCWLLWGPSIPICSCEMWTTDGAGALALQYGYGDENNSLPVYVTTEQVPALRGAVWGEAPADPGAGWHPGLARRMTLVGSLVAVDGVGRPLPPAQETVLTGGKYDYVLEFKDAIRPDGFSRGEYYSAYVWIMFEVDHRPGASGAPDQRWLRLLPFFEHTNIADANAYDFMKEQLARKALSFISRYGDASTVFRYACAFDDPGHGAGRPYTTLFSFARRTIRERVEEILAAPEFARIRPYVDIAPERPVLPACQLPRLVEQFYRHILDQDTAAP